MEKDLPWITGIVWKDKEVHKIMTVPFYKIERQKLVKIKFSRHAKRRAKLYKIPESTIIDILTSMDLSQGKHEIIKQVVGFNHPLKIVFSVTDDIITVITNYPLKKGRKNESIL